MNKDTLDGGPSESIWDMKEEERREKTENKNKRFVSIGKELNRQELIMKILLDAVVEDKRIREEFRTAQLKSFPYLEELEHQQELDDLKEDGLSKH